MRICEYGCGREAVHQFKNGKWCCNKDHKKCLGNIKKGALGKKGKNHTEEHKQKISKTLKKTYEDLEKRKTLSHKRTIEGINKKYPVFSKVEEMRYNPDKEIQVRCKNHSCSNSKEKNGWFVPDSRQFESRIFALDRDGNGGYYFYCSEDCKKTCKIYGKKITELIKQDQIKAGIIKESNYTQEEYNIWRQEVFKRDNNKCVYCGEPAVHAHHINPQKLEPFYALDPDNGIACCVKCHYKYGHKIGTECSTGQLANKIC